MANGEIFDVTVIGSGPGGYVAAIRAGAARPQDRVVERDPFLGGTCLHRGCIPTKALLHTADLLRGARGRQVRRRRRDVALDLAAVHRTRTVVPPNARGSRYLFKKNKVALGAGHRPARGRSDGRGHQARRRRAEKVAATNVILATGSRCGDLPFLTADGDRIINSDQTLELAEVPPRLLVLGAGAVGWSSPRSSRASAPQVTVVELLTASCRSRTPTSRPRWHKAFRRQGIDGTRGDPGRGGHVGRTASSAAASRRRQSARSWRPSKLLLAVGRKPTSRGSGSRARRSRSSAADISRRRVLPHPRGRGLRDRRPVAAERRGSPTSPRREGVLVVEHIAGKQPAADQLRPGAVVHVLLARGGARSASPRPRRARRATTSASARFPFTASGKAAILGETAGFVKVVGEAKYDEVLGVHIVGPHATELIAEGEAALRGELTAEELIRTIHAHPTLHEAIHEAAEGVHGQTIHF